MIQFPVVRYNTRNGFNFNANANSMARPWYSQLNRIDDYNCFALVTVPCKLARQMYLDGSLCIFGADIYLELVSTMNNNEVDKMLVKGKVWCGLV